MTDIDFIKQKTKSASTKRGKMNYGVEYTHPNKTHRSFKEWLSGFSKKRKHSAVAVPSAPARQSINASHFDAVEKKDAVVQPQAKPQVVPVAPMRPVTTMPVMATAPKNNSVDEKKLAPALAPLKKSIPTTAVPTVTAPAVTFSASPTTPAAPVKMKEVASPTSTPSLTTPADKTVLFKVQSAPTRNSMPTVTALRVIPTPPSPPLPPLPIVPAPRSLPTPPASPLHGLPATTQLGSKEPAPPLSHPTKVALSSKPSKTQATHAPKNSVGDENIQAHNVSQHGGVTTNPDKSIESFLRINLLPQLGASLTPIINKVQQLGNTVLAGCLVVGFVYLGVLGYQTYYFVRTTANLKKVDALENTILGYRSLQAEVNETSAQLTTINTLLDGHHYWTNIFTLLETYTLPNVYYTSVNADGSGTVTLQAVTSDYGSVSHQIEVFKKASRFIQGVEVSTASNTSSGDEKKSSSTGTAGLVTFNISLKLNPEVLQYHYAGYFKD